MDINKILAGLENFYQVWITGVRGNVIEVQKNLCNYHVISRQTAKALLRKPCIIFQGNRESAESEMEKLEALGLVCKIEHYGPEWLDSYDENTIISKLQSLNHASLKGIYLKEYQHGSYDIYGDKSDDPIYERYVDDVEESTEEFGLYLACIRFLAKNGAISEW